jgi:predicted transposase YbfD/YdcC
MATKERSRLVAALEGIPDPRRQCKNLRHRLVDVLVIGFCGVLCNCDDFVEIQEFGKAKEDFFRRFLELPNGIPSHDTFRRVFQAICPQAFQTCLIGWLKEEQPMTSGEKETGEKTVVAIDGKTLRRTFDRAKGLGALHLVSAWATENGLTLGQVAVDAKSNEITAIPKLLENLDLQDCVVTIDAAGCQKEIAETIIGKEADYVLALKPNHPTMHQEVTDYFLEQHGADPSDREAKCHRKVERGHGRTETRETFVAPAPKWLHSAAEWMGLCSIVMVIRQSLDHATQKETGDVRYFLSSLKPTARRLAGIVRSHWGIENSLHWVLDIAFNEDRLRAKDRNAIDNLALLNRLAVSVLRHDKTVKAGVKCKRKKAGWDDEYLMHLLHDTIHQITT